MSELSIRMIPRTVLTEGISLKNIRPIVVAVSGSLKAKTDAFEFSIFVRPAVYKM